MSFMSIFLAIGNFNEGANYRFSIKYERNERGEDKDEERERAKEKLCVCVRERSLIFLCLAQEKSKKNPTQTHN